MLQKNDLVIATVGEITIKALISDIFHATSDCAKYFLSYIPSI